MPIFMRIEGVPGTVTSGARAGWLELLGFELGGRAAGPRQHTGGMNVCLADGSVRMWARSEPVPPFWILTRKARGVSGADRIDSSARLGGVTQIDEGIAAEVDFTRVVGSGACFSDLRILMHGVRIVCSDRLILPGSRTPIESAVVSYTRITHPDASMSSPDITQQVRARLEMYDWPGEYAQRFDGVD